MTARSGRTLAVYPGKAQPNGVSIWSGCTQFCVFSRHATAVSLLLFADATDGEPDVEISFDHRVNRTGDMWHLCVEGLEPGQLYLYRVDGPFDPAAGHRFNRHMLLLDPYAKALTADFDWDLTAAYAYERHSPDLDLSFATTADVASMPKCIVVDDDAFDWQGDKPLNYPLRSSVIYEAHVKGLTADPSSNVEHPGTYRGVIEKIPYLRELGITSLELLPIMEFDTNEYRRADDAAAVQRSNYWGYSTIAFFAPKGSYAADRRSVGPVHEFKEMVRELHKAGIEVILDVVFNHTGEGSELGPTLSFKGLDNKIYYILEDNPRYYRNYSGCGNTLNCNNPILRNLIMDCLHYWVIEMHVDGFRFDLGSILGRDQWGNLMENPPTVLQIAEDPVLRHTKIIAEAWDAAGAYQVGWFPGGRWAEWNDRYRDDARRFWRGDPGMLAHLATRLAGSSDLYLRDGRKPFHSINFITSHDGFTLNDLVSYNEKHNELNGEQNRDGHNNNLSYNHGVEGPSNDPAIEQVRCRQVKNFIATLLLSLGTPMFLSGDEFRRTQNGNNNAYCHDNALSWLDYRSAKTHADVVRFFRLLVRFRLRHPAFHRPEFFTGQDNNYNAIPDITWFDEAAKPLDWAGEQNVMAVRIDGSKAEIQADRDDNDFFIMFNASSVDAQFALVLPPAGMRWAVAVNTARRPPYDIVAAGAERPVRSDRRYRVTAKSLVVLLTVRG